MPARSFSLLSATSAPTWRVCARFCAPAQANQPIAPTTSAAATPTATVALLAATMR